MSSDPLSDARIVDSWKQNASPWTAAVRENRIESRKLVTNDAIIDAVVSRAPRTVLDIGCGEGWLVRALAEHGIAGIGVDAVPVLIDQATRAGGGEFRVASYEAIADGGLDVNVDAAVANFSLIGKESVEGVIRRVPALLAKGGALIVQTLHPLIATGDMPYEDGWRHGSWAGFSCDFADPAPWYFRTVDTWKKVLTESGFDSIEVREPLHPAT
ncbi:MAG: class I SAM-dependent methyltransferase, partial [Gemmatimonadota bacterium]|nr:class I SAM-dependent methyltransferase [Gemmatimonadota bacterium]